jgi:hypothetical protein
MSEDGVGFTRDNAVVFRELWSWATIEMTKGGVLALRDALRQCSADDRNQRAAGSTTSFGKLDPSSGTLITAAAPRPGRRVPRRGPVTQPLPR